MKHLFIILALLLFEFWAKAENQPKANTIYCSIDASQKYQTVEGWGSSLCWWAHMVGRWNDSRIDTLINLFTSPDGLNMNIFRYNIGGGDNPDHIGGHMVNCKGKRAEMEGFKAGPDEPYNWDADKGQRNILLKIKEQRPDAIFEAFSNSPPYWMTYTGCSSGNHDKYNENLKPEYYGAFCDYLLAVCDHYKNNYGIKFKTLEPFNEPTSGYWTYMGGQEGCYFSAEEQIKLIKTLYPKLQESGLNTIISASDETSIHDFNKVLKKYIQDGEVLGMVGQLNTHSYHGSIKDREIAHKLVTKTGKEFWQSESGPMGLEEPAKGLKNNLLLTQKLFDDMRIMKPSAWIDWQLMEEHNDIWGLVRCNFDTEEYTILKNLYVRMQVTRFIKQGYKIINSDNRSVLAAVSSDMSQMVMVLLNKQEEPTPFIITLENFKCNIKDVTMFRTTQLEDCKLLKNSEIAESSDKKFKYEAPALSLTTLTIKNDNKNK